MIFISGVSRKTKEIAYRAATFICNRCGRYGQYQVFMTYTCLSLFFIPVFKWDRRYFVKTSCCGTVYELDPEVGKRLARGEDISIMPNDLTFVADGHQMPSWQVPVKRCSYCGYETQENFDFCPKCGQRLQ